MCSILIPGCHRTQKGGKQLYWIQIYLFTVVFELKFWDMMNECCTTKDKNKNIKLCDSHELLSSESEFLAEFCRPSQPAIFNVPFTSYRI